MANEMDTLEQFKSSCRAYLFRQSISVLRAYGASLGLKYPIKTKKKLLIEDIVALLCGERTPFKTEQYPLIKSDSLDPKFLKHMDKLIAQYFNGERPANKETTRDTDKKTEEENSSNNIKITLNLSNLTTQQVEKLTGFLKTL